MRKGWLALRLKMCADIYSCYFSSRFVCVFSFLFLWPTHRCILQRHCLARAKFLVYTTRAHNLAVVLASCIMRVPDATHGNPFTLHDWTSLSSHNHYFSLSLRSLIPIQCIHTWLPIPDTLQPWLLQIHSRRSWPSNSVSWIVIAPRHCNRFD